MAGARGEAYLMVEGQRVEILYTNYALATVEQATGKPLLTLLREVTENRLSIEDTAKSLQAGMDRARQEGRPSGRPVTLAEAFRVLDAVGFTAVAEAVYTAMSAVLMYSEAGEEPADPPA